MRLPQACHMETGHDVALLLLHLLPASLASHCVADCLTEAVAWMRLFLWEGKMCMLQGWLSLTNFTQFCAAALERVVGSARARRMSKAGVTPCFMFC